MKERLFTLKSYQRGLELHIRPNADMPELLTQLQEKFHNSRQFFGNLQVGLAISGKELTEEEEDAVLDAIEENSELKIACLIGSDQKIQDLFEEASEKMERQEDNEPKADGLFYRGTLKKGQSLVTEYSLVVLGDVNPGAKVISRRDVIVLGALLGEVHAGSAQVKSEAEGRLVCALEFSPEKLKIGDYRYSKKPAKLLPDFHKNSPKIAFLQGEEIAVKPVTKELLGQITLRGV